MRSENASTSAGSIASKPCSRYTAAIAASSTAARTFRLREMRWSSSAGASPACSRSRSPSPSSFATAAQLWRETTCARTFASLPSDACAEAVEDRARDRELEDAVAQELEPFVRVCAVLDPRGVGEDLLEPVGRELRDQAAELVRPGARAGLRPDAR